MISKTQNMFIFENKTITKQDRKGGTRRVKIERSTFLGSAHMHSECAGKYSTSDTKDTNGTNLDTNSKNNTNCIFSTSIIRLDLLKIAEWAYAGIFAVAV